MIDAINCTNSDSGKGLSCDGEHLAELSAEGKVALALPQFLGGGQVAGELDQVLLDVGGDDALKVGSVLEDGSPGLKGGDILADVSAVLKELGGSLDDSEDLMNASGPLFVQEVLEGLDGTLSLGLAVFHAGFDLGEALAFDDTVDEAKKHGVVLVGSQLADGLG